MKYTPRWVMVQIAPILGHKSYIPSEEDDLIFHRFSNFDKQQETLLTSNNGNWIVNFLSKCRAREIKMINRIKAAGFYIDKISYL